MRKGTKYYLECISILVYALVIVLADDEGEQENDNRLQLSEEYLSIFENMPILYEYILATLQEKPEVLEISHNYLTDAILSKRNADPSIDDNNSNFMEASSYDKAGDYISTYIKSKRSIEDDSDNDENKVSNIKKSSNDNFGYEYHAIPSKNGVESLNDAEFIESHVRDFSNYNSGDSFYVGEWRVSALDSNEVEERAIWVDNELEKHNEH